MKRGITLARVAREMVEKAGVKDHRTYDLSLSILLGEIEHEAWFSEFLGEGLSRHFQRRTRGESPSVYKSLHP